MPVTRVSIEKCIGCEICLNTCPCDVFRMDEKTNKSIIAYAYDCQVCGMCGHYCPTGSITVTPEKGIKPMTAYR
jgi:NAD-dependent dihydropyrimidine dehydrogenase PreA subunit